jgi:ketosteroid isomerase-like protein
MRRILLAALLVIAAAAPAYAEESASDTLKRQTQELFDAVSAGDPAVWDKYLDADVAFTDENGVISDRKDTVAQVTPLPKGISGTITIVNWVDRDLGDTHVTTFDSDEHEDFHGQKLHALYRATGVWRKTTAGWKLIAMQSIALHQDPPAVMLPPETLSEYVGEYAAADDLHYVIALANGELTGTATGGKPVVLKAELKDVLFVPGQPRSRKIFTRDAAGRVTGYLGRREERDVVWTKVK